MRRGAAPPTPTTRSATSSTTTDAAGTVTTLVHDLRGRKTALTDPDMGAWSYTYNTLGELVSQTDAKGQTVTMAYDRLGRMTSRTEAEGTTTWTYDTASTGTGRLHTVSAPGGYVRTHAYDTYARAKSETLTLGTETFTTARTYDAKTGLIRTLQSGPGESVTVQDLGYAFDPLGNLTPREDFRAGVYERFTYDTPDRLTGATVHDATTEAALASKRYTYDALGNIATKSDVGAAAYVYGTGNAAGAGDAGPHAVVSAGGHTYAYDDNGNLTSGAGRTLTWTSFNQPATLATTTTTTTFAYGPERARIRQTRVQGSTTTTITYVGTVFEQVARTGAATKRVHYLFAVGGCTSDL